MESVPRTAKKAMQRVLQADKNIGIPDFCDVEDPRGARGKRYQLTPLLRLCFACMLGAYSTLRRIVAFGWRYGIRVSYTALYLLLGQFKSEQFRPLLHRQVRGLQRAKALEPEGLPCHVIAVDNKTLYYGPRKLNRDCQKTEDTHSGHRRYHLRALRAVLTSSPMTLAIDQQIIPAPTNDMGFFGAFYRGLQAIYGRSLMAQVIITADAGMTSLANTNLVDGDGCGYVFRVKGNQSGLMAEAERIFALLRSTQEAELTTVWEVYQGREKRYKLYRSEQMKGWPTESGDWHHLRQVWLVLTEVRDRTGRKKTGRRKQDKRIEYTEPKVIEERYFATNLLYNYLKPAQILSVVRGHWNIENNCNWTTDVQWNEDDSPWCRKGEALAVLSLLRLMAYNTMQWLKHRHIRNQRMRAWGWQEWFDFVKELLLLFLRVSPDLELPEC